MQITFEIPILPKPSNRRRAALVGGHARVVQDPGVRDHQETVAALAAQHRPRELIHGPVTLEILALFPQRASTRARDRHRYQRHDSRPDYDNVAKSIGDALTLAGFWADDSQIAVGRVEKIWARHGEPGRYRVRLTWDEDAWLDNLPF